MLSDSLLAGFGFMLYGSFCFYQWPGPSITNLQLDFEVMMNKNDDQETTLEVVEKSALFVTVKLCLITYSLNL
jgi:hypothetical protein